MTEEERQEIAQLAAQRLRGESEIFMRITRMAREGNANAAVLLIRLDQKDKADKKKQNLSK